MGWLGFDGVEVDDAPKDAIPVCPHCDSELKRIWVKSEGIGGIGEKHIVMCPSCRRFLAYAMWRT
jgi:hypothetical protein